MQFNSCTAFALYNNNKNEEKARFTGNTLATDKAIFMHNEATNIHNTHLRAFVIQQFKSTSSTVFR